MRAAAQTGETDEREAEAASDWAVAWFSGGASAGYEAIEGGDVSTTDKRRPQGWSLADELKASGMVPAVEERPVVPARLSADEIVAAAMVQLDPVARREARAAMPKPEMTEPTKRMTRAEIVSKAADVLERKFAGRLDKLGLLPFSEEWEEMSGEARERLLDAIAEVEARNTPRVEVSEEERAAFAADLDEPSDEWSDDDEGWAF